MAGGASFLGVSLAGGASFLGGVSLAGGASFLGGSPWQGASLFGVSLAGGCLLLWGSPWQRGIPVCTEAEPPVNRITHSCKNITLATTSLQPVTRLDSSRMHTTHLLSISHSMHCTGGVCCSDGGACFWSRGCLSLVPVGRGACLWFWGWVGGCIPACSGADPPPPVNRITGACKNITLPQLVAGGDERNGTEWGTSLMLPKSPMAHPLSECGQSAQRTQHWTCSAPSMYCRRKNTGVLIKLIIWSLDLD